MSADSSPLKQSVEEHELDVNALPQLPSKNKISVWAMLAVQALNAFTDNFAKILLVALAGVVAAGSDLGDSMQLYLGAIFSLPYILFAPVAGWLSDRFSKQKVILWMQLTQLAVFLLFHSALFLKHESVSLQLSLFCFFLLATQSAFFSPAKMGIGKELVGSSRIGNLTGKLQLTNFMGILGGMGLAGWWFGSLIQEWSQMHKAAQALSSFSAVFPGVGSVWHSCAELTLEVSKSGLTVASWDAANHLLGVATGIALLQVLGSFLIQKTPNHKALKFQAKIWIEHIEHLKLLFAQRSIKLAAIGITFFWFMSNSVGSMLVTLSHEMHPVDKSAAAKELSMMPAMLGIGVMLGSVLAGWICRRRLEMGLVPISGFFLAASLLWTGVVPVAPSIYLALIGVGMAGGAFMTPLYAFVQDRSKPEERARILSAINLLDCVGAIVANMVMIKLLLHFEVSSATQLLCLVPMAVVAAIYVTRLLPQGVLRMVALFWVRVGYRLKAYHEDRVPKEDGVLLLPNHVSYVDTLILGAASKRDLRFVMLDSLYETPRWKWAFKAFGTVPISAERAREAIKTVAKALQEDQAVVLFSEGQLTRIGFSNYIRKGYELMARLGKSKIQIVWIDGLWHSMFAFKDGYAIRKTPQRVPLNVQVLFGPLLEVEEATPWRIRLEWMKLNAEAFGSRKSVMRALRENASVAKLNALRLDETNLFHAGDFLFLDLPESHELYSTFAKEVPSLQKMKLTESRASMEGHETKVVSFNPVEEYAYILMPIEQLNETPPPGVWLYEKASGVLLTVSGLSPTLIPGEEEIQVTAKRGAYGRVLPGFEVIHEEGAVRIRGLMGSEVREITIPELVMDEDGFLVPSPK